MTAMTRSQSVHSDTFVELARQADHHSALYYFTGRLIQITLALYLLPAFLIVLTVGGVGILVLKTYRGLSGLLEG